jgi:hypothetical protein
VLGTYYLVNQPVGGIAAPIFGAVADAAGIGTAFAWLVVAFAVLAVLALGSVVTGGARIRAVSSPG